MSRFSIFVLVFLCFCTQQVRAEQPDSTFTLQATLDNGLQVVIQSVPWEKLVWVEAIYSAGSASEPDSLAGLAHLAEHMLTESGRRYPDGELRRRQTLFSTYRNASTSVSSMNFYSQCLPVFLPEILDLEADRMGGAIIDSLGFAREKAVVQEELAFRYQFSPYQDFFEAIYSAAYPDHPFAQPIGGIHESVGEIKLKDLRDFRDSRIVPARGVLVIRGPVDPQEVLKTVGEKFSFGPSSDPVVPTYPPYPPVAKNQIVMDSPNDEGVDVWLGCRVPLADAKTTALTYALGRFLERSWIGLLTLEVPDEVLVVFAGGMDYSRQPDDPEKHWGMVYEDFDPDQSAQRLMGYLWRDLNETLRHLQEEKEFEAGRARALEGINDQAMDAGTGIQTGRALVNGNESLDPDTYAKIIEELTPADLMDFAARYLVPNRAVVVINHGRDSERLASINMVSRKKPESRHQGTDVMDQLGSTMIDPVLETYRNAGLFEFEKVNLPNGIPVHCLVLPDSDHWNFAGLRTFNHLKELKPGKKCGLDRFYSRVVTYDDRQRYNPDRPVPPQELPFNLTVDLKPWSFQYSAEGNIENANDVVALMARRFKSREFNTARWGSILRRGALSLEKVLNNPTYQARSWRWRQLFDDDHPAPFRCSPDPKAAADYKYKDLQKLHRKATGSVGNTVLISAGPMTGSEAKSILVPKFGRQGEFKPESWKSDPRPRETGIQGRIFPDLEQADLVLILSFGPFKLKGLGPNAGTTLEMFNTVLRTCLVSRLREEEGMTYSLGCTATPVGGSFVLNVAVTCQPAEGPEVMDVLTRELRAFREHGFQDDQWARARLEYVGRCIANFSEAGSGSRSLLRLASFGNSASDPMATLFQVEKQEINDLATQILDLKRYVFSLTGPLFEEDIDQYENFGAPSQELGK